MAAWLWGSSFTGALFAALTRVFSDLRACGGLCRLLGPNSDNMVQVSVVVTGGVSLLQLQAPTVLDLGHWLLIRRSLWGAPTWLKWRVRVNLYTILQRHIFHMSIASVVYLRFFFKIFFFRQLNHNTSSYSTSCRLNPRHPLPIQKCMLINSFGQHGTCRLHSCHGKCDFLMDFCQRLLVVLQIHTLACFRDMYRENIREF